jgi:hypothetical protein
LFSEFREFCVDRESVTAAQFRHIALGLDGVVEGAHMGHPDFRLGGRIFATLTADERRGMVTLPLDQQERFVRGGAGPFVPAAGAWGRQGSTLVDLASADVETVGEAMTIAWQLALTKAAARKNVSATMPRSKKASPSKGGKRGSTKKSRPSRRR